MVSLASTLVTCNENSLDIITQNSMNVIDKTNQNKELLETKKIQTKISLIRNIRV